MMASGAASLGSAGVRMRISSKMCTMCTPSRLFAPPAHFTQRRSSCKEGADHEARWAGAWRGEGSVPGVLERQGEDVDLRRWCAWRRRGERERWWRGLGVGVVYGSRREGEVDLGRRWRSWWRPPEREQRERGPGGSWWGLGERERHKLVVEARWQCAVRGGERERRRLRDRASSLESGQSGGVGGS